MRNFIIVILFFFAISCKQETMPKPKGYLSLEYPEKSYVKLDIERPYSFDILEYAVVKNLPKNWLKIEYPNLKASVDITYRPIKGNLRELLIEAEKLVFEHAIKAEQIASNDFANKEANVYGKMYDITGNSASQVQFHVTDSSKHFLKGSLFFYSKPNYDSILPAVDYIKKDMIQIMETLRWSK